MIAVFLFSGTLSAHARMEELELAAETAFEKGRFEEAAALYGQVIALDPVRPGPYSRLIWSLFHAGEAQGDGRLSLRKFRKAAERALEMAHRFPTLPESHFLVAFTHGVLALQEGGSRRIEDARTAERGARRALELDPDYAPAYVVLGIGYRELARLPAPLRWLVRRLWEGEYPTFQMAENALREALNRQSDSVFALEQMGETVEIAGRWKEARTWYQRALAAKAETPLDRSAQARARLRLALIPER